jgi:hypothetical protein
MTPAEQIAEANARQRQAEARELEMRIRLAIVREKIGAHETAEAKRQRDLIDAAVKMMVTSGAIPPGDHAARLDMTAQLLNDPSLIPLALTKTVYRARPAVNHR